MKCSATPSGLRANGRRDPGSLPEGILNIGSKFYCVDLEHWKPSLVAVRTSGRAGALDEPGPTLPGDSPGACYSRARRSCIILISACWVVKISLAI
jgi:hypothetical protein